MRIFNLLLFFYVVVSITDDEIRECVFMALDERFDSHFAQAENLTMLFIAVHDGVSCVQF